MIERDEVLKQDALGRVRVPVERRRALVEEFAKSGNSAAQFARLAGIKYQTFTNWVQKERRGASRARVHRPAEENDPGARGGGQVRLFEALVEGGSGTGRRSGGLVVELPGGSRMEINSPVQAQMAAELVALIAQRVRGPRC